MPNSGNRCVFVSLSILSLLLSIAAHAQEVLTLKGTTDGVQCQFLTPIPITDTSQSQSFNIISSTVPAGYACTFPNCQVGWNAPSGVLRLTTNPVGIGGATQQATFTWGFPQYIHAGVYSAAGGSGFE